MLNLMTKYDALAISGGAARGAAFLGVLHKLSEVGHLQQLMCVSGTSIGALAAVLVALRVDMKQALAAISSKPFEMEADLLSLDPPFGLNSGAELLEFIRSLVGTRTLQQLRNTHGINVIICATSLHHKRPVYFSPDTHPDMEAAWAVRLSCTLPLLFACGCHDGDAFVDGGLTDNFPVAPLLHLGYSNILGLRLTSPDPNRLPQEVTEYILALMACVAWQAKSQDGDCTHVIELEVSQQAAFDFSMSPPAMAALFSIGYNHRV